MRTVAALVLLLLLAACGNAGPGGGGGADAGGFAPTELPTPVPPAGELLGGQGTVLDAGDGPRLCLGGVAESLPPQCDGAAMTGWSWKAAAPYWEESAGTRWGEFAVVGTWDGTRFTVRRDPVPLALYDAAPRREAPPASSDLTPAQLEEVHDEIHTSLRPLTSYVEDGRVVALVVYDDGTLQSEMDRQHGAGAVLVESALQPAGA